MSEREEYQRYELPRGWAWCALADLVESITDGPFGSNLKTSDYVDDGEVRVIRLGNIGVGEFKDEDQSFVSREKFSSLLKHEARAGDIVIAALAEPVGRACLVPHGIGPAIVKADCVRARIDDRIWTDIVTRWLNSPEGLKSAALASHGIGRLRINLGEIRALPVPLPPSNEQRRIVATIDAIFEQTRAAKARLERMPTLLDKLKRSILAAAFRGDLTADWRAAHSDAEPASTLLDGIRAERRARWEMSLRAKDKTPSKLTYNEPAALEFDDLPSLPTGWRWASLGFISDIQSGITKGQKRKPDDVLREVPYLRVANVQRGHLNLDEVLSIEATQREIDDLTLVPGDMLLNEGGDRDKLGRGWVWEAQIPLCIHQNHVFRARLYVGGIDPKLVSTYANAFGQPWFIDEGKQTTNLASISKSKLSRFPVPIPPAEEQVVLAERIFALLSTIDTLAARVAAAAVRSAKVERAVLAKAFRGELVTQDPNDEPASELLARLKAQQASAAAKSPRQAPKTRVKRSTMSTSHKDAIKAIILKQKVERFSFDELRSQLPGDYEALKTALFELLDEPSPVVRQVFDPKAKAMQLERARS